MMKDDAVQITEIAVYEGFYLHFWEFYDAFC